MKPKKYKTCTLHKHTFRHINDERSMSLQSKSFRACINKRINNVNNVCSLIFKKGIQYTYLSIMHEGPKNGHLDFSGSTKLDPL